ncbi:hypothetical protein PAMA_014294 [Pampus argenteus]
MDLGDGLQKKQVDISPSVSSYSSWTSFDLSTDLTSLSSDCVSTPVTAPGGCHPYEYQHPKTCSAKVSSEVRTRVVVWRETSFLGNDELKGAGVGFSFHRKAVIYDFHSCPEYFHHYSDSQSFPLITGSDAQLCSATLGLLPKQQPSSGPFVAAHYCTLAWITALSPCAEMESTHRGLIAAHLSQVDSSRKDTLFPERAEVWEVILSVIT